MMMMTMIVILIVTMTMNNIYEIDNVQKFKMRGGGGSGECEGVKGRNMQGRCC